MHGNSNTNPKGTEIAEFLLSRIRRLKKAKRGIAGPPFSFKAFSRDEASGEYVTRLTSLCMMPIEATERPSAFQTSPVEERRLGVGHAPLDRVEQYQPFRDRSGRARLAEIGHRGVTIAAADKLAKLER